MRTLTIQYGGIQRNTTTITTVQLRKLDSVKDIAKKELSNKRLFVVDGFCGTHKIHV